MTRNRRRKRKKLSSSSSLEGSSTFQDEVSGPQMVSEDEVPSLADVWKVLTEIKSNTEKLVNDVDLLEVTYKELQENLASTKIQVDILMKENKSLKSKVKSLEDDLFKSKAHLKEIEQRLDDVEARHDDLEQYTQKFNLGIHGIAEREEDNAENVIELGKLFNVNLTQGDIDIVHRLNTKSKTEPCPIIVRFASYNAKNKLYKARLHLRNVTSHGLGLGKIYINENLTSRRTELFKEVRKVRKKYHNGKAWTVDGKIFFKPELTSKAQRIDSYEDLKAL